MDVQLIPVDPDENYKKVGVRDANLIAYTAKVNAFGHSAYLAADLEARGGYEDRIASIVGHVDLLKPGTMEWRARTSRHSWRHSAPP